MKTSGPIKYESDEVKTLKRQLEMMISQKKKLLNEIKNLKNVGPL